MIQVGILEPVDDAAWDTFLNARPEATLYHSRRYRDLLLAVTGARDEYLVAKRDGEIVGGLPLMSREGEFGTVLNSLPFFGSHGGVVAVDDAAAEALWRAYEARLADPGVAAATIVGNPFSDRPTVPASPPLEDHRISQVTPLAPSPCAGGGLLDRMEGSARRNIQKAQRSGVTVSVENDATDFLAEQHYANMRAMGGTAKPQAFFDTLPRVFRPNRDFRIYVARIDDRPVAALLLFYYKHFVEYFTPVSREDDREAQPMSAILLRAMSDSSNDGYRVWNWGGTWATQIGVYRFKRKWGADERRYSYAVTLRNKALLRESVALLRSAYPWFFVLPFSSLEAPG